MSKDMLGSLTRASVRLTPQQINLTRDVVNRLTGEGGEAWRAHLKRILRDGLPDQPPLMEPAPQPPVLKLINGAINLGAIDTNNPTEFFQTRPGLWVSEGFKQHVVSKAKPVQNLGSISLISHELMKKAHDCDIMPGLGQNYVFDESAIWRTRHPDPSAFLILCILSPGDFSLY